MIVSTFTFLLVTLCAVLCSGGLYAGATVNPDSSYYVTDKSGVLSIEVKQHILEVNHLFENTEQKPQVAVVVVPTLDGVDIETYALEQFEKMEIGNSEYDNGALILLATDDREIRVEIGYGLEGILPDSKVGRIIDESVDLLADGEYSLAIRDIFNQLVYAIQTEYEYEDVFNGTVSSIDEDSNDKAFIVMILAAFIIGHVIYFGICKMIGLSFGEALVVLLELYESIIISSSSSSGSRGSRSSGGGGRSGGGGASRGF